MCIDCFLRRRLFEDEPDIQVIQYSEMVGSIRKKSPRLNECQSSTKDSSSNHKINFDYENPLSSPPIFHSSNQVR